MIGGNQNMKFSTIILSVSILLMAQSTVADELPTIEPQHGYTTNTLKEPIYNHSEVMMEAMKFTNWLAANYEKIPKDQLKGPREHLYYLIDSYVKHLYGSQKIIMPQQPDAILDMLFSWADRLGVLGGAIIYDAVKATKLPDPPLALKTPEQFSLKLEGDLLSIHAKDNGWEVKVPYYFMIGSLQNFQATNGMPTQMSIISTGAALDNSQFGKSQATLMLIYCPDTDIDKFSAFWKQAIKIEDEAREIDLAYKGLKSLYTQDSALNLHKEFTYWQEEKGSFGVFYSGIDGTYQWNRPHFLDFLKSLKTSPPPT